MTYVICIAKITNSKNVIFNMYRKNYKQEKLQIAKMTYVICIGKITKSKNDIYVICKQKLQIAKMSYLICKAKITNSKNDSSNKFLRPFKFLNFC